MFRCVLYPHTHGGITEERYRAQAWGATVSGAALAFTYTMSLKETPTRKRAPKKTKGNYEETQK